MRRALVLLGATLVACAPEFDDDASRITVPRILAVRSEPAEAAPGTALIFSAFIALPEGSSAPVPSWAFCRAPKPPTENNVVSSDCLAAAALDPVGQGTWIQAQIPVEACSLFGPNTPPGALRPRDPDVTGGYYQPLRVDLNNAPPTFHLQRVLCPLGQAPSEVATQFGMSYVPNQNPHLGPLVVRQGGRVLALSQIQGGTRVELEVSWNADDAETYPYFERSRQALLSQREAMSVAWYVSAGKLAASSSGRSETDSALTANNQFTAPRTPGPSKLWIVLRDSRGGVDFAAYDLGILP
ncbi:MAG: hypothetical protein ABI488_04655 [Polyangiaceae bacterium]